MTSATRTYTQQTAAPPPTTHNIPSHDEGIKRDVDRLIMTMIGSNMFDAAQQSQIIKWQNEWNAELAVESIKFDTEEQQDVAAYKLCRLNEEFVSKTFLQKTNSADAEFVHGQTMSDSIKLMGLVDHDPSLRRLAFQQLMESSSAAGRAFAEVHGLSQKFESTRAEVLETIAYAKDSYREGLSCLERDIRKLMHIPKQELQNVFKTFKYDPGMTVDSYIRDPHFGQFVYNSSSKRFSIIDQDKVWLERVFPAEQVFRMQSGFWEGLKDGLTVIEIQALQKAFISSYKHPQLERYPAAEKLFQFERNFVEACYLTDHLSNRIVNDSDFKYLLDQIRKDLK